MLEDLKKYGWAYMSKILIDDSAETEMVIDLIFKAMDMKFTVSDFKFNAWPSAQKALGCLTEDGKQLEWPYP